jgi:DNA-binding Lrp family transcriptional regulator
MPQKPTKPIRKAQLWAKRSRHLRTQLDNLALKKTQHLDAQALIKVFLIRKSLRLKLSDAYLAKVWRMSLRNVQNRLQQLEEVGLIKRFTQPPRKRPEGWRQERTICLIIRSSSDSLACKKSRQSNLQAKPVEDNSTLQVKSLDFVDYLSLQKRVSKGAWAYWLRKNGASSRTMGFLLTNVFQKITNRPDVLESILFDGEAANLRGSKLIGYVVNETKVRIPIERIK